MFDLLTDEERDAFMFQTEEEDTAMLEAQRLKTLRQVVEWLRVRDVRYHQPDGGSMAAFAVIQDLAEDQGINLEEENGD